MELIDPMLMDLKSMHSKVMDLKLIGVPKWYAAPVSSSEPGVDSQAPQSYLLDSLMPSVTRIGIYVDSLFLKSVPYEYRGIR